MSTFYTYFKADEGGYVGYWNDYPDYLTEGETLGELKEMLLDLRRGIDVMVQEGEIPTAKPAREEPDDMLFPDAESAISYLHANDRG